MIDKISEYSFINKIGEESTHLIKRKEIKNFPRKYIPDDLKLFLKNFKAEKGNIYVLNSALGSGEFWGTNSRGDRFPESGLIHRGSQWGYDTYNYYGSLFRHHINKDVLNSYGEVVLSSWDPELHRVLLVIKIPIEKKNEDIIQRINNDEPIETSMASKQPYDICSICGNISKRISDHCSHINNELLNIYPDG